MAEPFTVIEHTADIGLRVTGDDLDALFANAARGMFSLICDLDSVREATQTRVSVQEEDIPYRLHDWLAEWLYLFDTRQRVFRRFEVTHEGARVHGVAHGEPVDPERHDLGTEIKAVTAHELDVRREGAIWTATVIFDL